MEKKYEFVEETREIIVNPRYIITLHRIKALKDFSDVMKGDLGGWIESEDNLSQEGDCWVYDEGIIWGNARVCGNAFVKDHANVGDNAKVWSAAKIRDHATVAGNANVYTHAVICDHAVIKDNATIFENARIDGCTCVWECAKIFGDAKISGNANIHGYARIFGHTRVVGEVDIYQYVSIDSDVFITSEKDFLIVGPIGSRYDYTIFIKTQKEPHIYVCCGCFRGDINEFEEAVKIRHGDRDIKSNNGFRFAEEYFTAIEYAKTILGHR